MNEFREFAEALLPRAGKVALRYFRTPLTVDNKGEGAFDPVTAADRGVEAVVRAALSARYPEHGLVGEEHGLRDAAGPYRWIIDPVDGTRAFITGMPLWGILLGLLHRQSPQLGFMYQPYLDELFGGDGHSAWLRYRGARHMLHTSNTARLAAASLYSTHPDMFADPAASEAFRVLSAQCRLHRFGGDCYSYCMLAAGHVDLVLEAGLAAYDILPLVPIIEGAGGVVTDWQGEPLTGGGRVLAAATPELHAAAVGQLAAA